MNIAETIQPYYDTSTYGSSNDAIFVQQEIGAVNQDFNKQEPWASEIQQVLEELYRVVCDCSKPNWDGYGAQPVATITLLHAIKTVYSLPSDTQLPTIGTEPDGQITLEWYRSPRYILSISVSPEGELHYASLLGANKQYGTEQFSGKFPETILQIIKRLSRI